MGTPKLCFQGQLPCLLSAQTADLASFGYTESLGPGLCFRGLNCQPLHGQDLGWSLDLQDHQEREINIPCVGAALPPTSIVAHSPCWEIELGSPLCRGSSDWSRSHLVHRGPTHRLASYDMVDPVVPCTHQCMHARSLPFFLWTFHMPLRSHYDYPSSRKSSLISLHSVLSPSSSHSFLRYPEWWVIFVFDWLPCNDRAGHGLYSCLRTLPLELYNLPTTLKSTVSQSLTLPKSKQGRDPSHFTNREVSLQEEWCQPGPRPGTGLIKKFCFLDLTLQCRFHANAGH